ncbi:hypothetical protein [Streptacidiphilus fuscans]|uniref:Tetratricopeptide repeat protein n=1 Tax=Streptacidiphilus fuscans TaxID=2789292 RepID=A0A931FEE1_9ACTN|nr:hypothetical protein [Streptacidiphilus fuscans]MBF9067429.1 hypothetical protein [Streptacidiphilus fuscans]
MGVIAGWRQQRAEKEAAATVAVLRQRAERLRQLARVGEGEQVLAEAVRVAEAVFPQTSAPVFAARRDRAHTLFQLQRVAEGEAEVRDLLASATKVPDLPAAWTSALRLTLAQALLLQARFAEAEAEARMAAAEEEHTGSVSGPLLLALVAAVAGQGRHAEATAEADALSDSLQDGPLDRLRLRSLRGVQLMYLGRLEEAVAEHRAVAKEATALSGQPAAYVRLMAQHNLAAALLELDRMPEAAAEAQAGMTSAARRGPNFGYPAFLFQVLLARLHNRSGEHAEALRVAEQALAGRPEPSQLADDEERAHAVRVEALRGLGRTAEAEAVSHASFESLARRHGPSHYRTLAAETLLGRCVAQTRVERREEALTLLRGNVASWRTHFGAQHPRTIRAERALDAVEAAVEAGAESAG